MSKKRYEAKIFLDKKQKEHFKKFGVYADVNSKIAEWMQEYADIEVKKLSIPVVSDIVNFNDLKMRRCFLDDTTLLWNLYY